MIDFYTKTVLTAIAVALAVIAIRGPLGATSANALGEGCGDKFDPCHVTITDKVQLDTGLFGIPVYIKP